MNSIVISLAIMMCGCDVLDPNRQLITRDKAVPLISVSPEVDRLLSAERIQDAEGVARAQSQPNCSCTAV